jgi:hypothetical protein
MKLKGVERKLALMVAVFVLLAAAVCDCRVPLRCTKFARIFFISVIMVAPADVMVGPARQRNVISA